MADEDFWDFDLPISRRGRFFQDSTFEDTRSDFDKKVKDILGKWGDEDFLSDAFGDDSDRRHTSNFNRYRNLRSSRNLPDDNQAFTVTSKDDAHKVSSHTHIQQELFMFIFLQRLALESSV